MDGIDLIWCSFDCDLCMMEGRDCVKTVKIKEVDCLYFSFDSFFNDCDQDYQC